MTYPPGFGASDPEAEASRFARLLMHRTATIDYGVILAGELTLVLGDGSESTLRAGDVIVQNGVVHGWRNTTSTTAVAVFVLVGYRS
jgi:quercetin dioxygenase-like cupin family protein